MILPLPELARSRYFRALVKDGLYLHPSRSLFAMALQTPDKPEDFMEAALCYLESGGEYYEDVDYGSRLWQDHYDRQCRRMARKPYFQALTLWLESYYAACWTTAQNLLGPGPWRINHVVSWRIAHGLALEIDYDAPPSGRITL